MDPVAETYGRFVNPELIRLLDTVGYGRTFTRARGTTVWDAQGKEYLDLLAGYGSFNLGHNHPRLVARLKALLDEGPLNLNHVGPSPLAAELGKALAAMLPPPLEMTVFASTGAEAVEAGLKLARAATRRPGLVSCEGGFHGLSFGALSASGFSRLRGPFEPLLPGFAQVPFGDLPALERALAAGDIAAFLVEPAQIEAGLRFPPPGYLREAASLCRRHGALFILDEVQTGLGRTGTLFAFEQEGLVPDVLVLAKSLGGGIAAVGAAVTSRELWIKAYGTAERHDLQTTTFGGSAFACAAALETLSILQEEGLAPRSAVLGRRLLEGLRARLSGHPLVKDIRGKGLLVGVELGRGGSGRVQDIVGQWVCLKLLEAGVLCQTASQDWSVLRLEPPLTISEAEVDRAVDAVAGMLERYDGMVKPILETALRAVGRKISPLLARLPVGEARR